MRDSMRNEPRRKILCRHRNRDRDNENDGLRICRILRLGTPSSEWTHREMWTIIDMWIFSHADRVGKSPRERNIGKDDPGIKRSDAILVEREKLSGILEKCRLKSSSDDTSHDTRCNTSLLLFDIRSAHIQRYEISLSYLYCATIYLYVEISQKYTTR
jgi:hypothetical protein